MRPRVLAILLAILMAWMGFSAQTHAASRSAECLVEQALSHAQAPIGGALADHHLDELPVQLLADLVGLWPQAGVTGPAGKVLRPDGRLAQAGASPHLAGLRRPPIPRA